MIVFVSANENIYTIDCKSLVTIEDLKKKINLKVRLKNNNYWLSSNGKLLMNDFKISDHLFNESTVFLNFRPLEFVKVKYGDKIKYVELSILMESSLLPYNIDFDKYGEKDQINKIIDNFDYVIYEIPEKYFDDEIYKIWYELYKLSKKENYKIRFQKPIKNKHLKSNIYLKFYKILNKVKFENVIKLNNLFAYLDIDHLLNIVSYYLANEYFFDIQQNDMIKFIKNLE
jgi:hypothetical protein